MAEMKKVTETWRDGQVIERITETWEDDDITDAMRRYEEGKPSTTRTRTVQEMARARNRRAEALWMQARAFPHDEPISTEGAPALERWRPIDAPNVCLICYATIEPPYHRGHLDWHVERILHPKGK